MASTDSIFGQYPTAEWTVKGQTIAFPVLRIEETHSNRIIEHERMYRKGARLDDTHSKAKVWRITVEAFNSEWQEAEIERLAFYPDELNKLLDSFDEHETGDLVLPTRGPKRCRAKEYSRTEEATERDMAVVVLTFVEDNEDDASASAWQAPSAQSVVVKKAEDAVRDSQDQAAMQGDFATSLREAAAAIESYANAPFEFVGDMEAQVASLQSTVDKVEETCQQRISEAQNEMYTLMTDPMSSRAMNGLRAVSDIAGHAVSDKLGQGPKLTTRTFPTDTTLFAIAPIVGMLTQRLLELNPGLDPFNVPANTPVTIEE